MRNDGGFEVIKKAIEKLGLRHKEHISAYGEGNERRLTGKHETADINTFKWVNINSLAQLLFGNMEAISFTLISSFSFSTCLPTGGRKPRSIGPCRSRHGESRKGIL